MSPVVLLVGLLTAGVPGPDGGVGGCTIVRDDAGRIHRSRHAIREFKHLHPCPANGKRSGACPGYVIDHVVPLACGGCDIPANMQWQTVSDGKAKDRWERKACGGD